MNRWTPLALVALVALLGAGCAYNQQPVVEMSGVDPAQYQRDLAYCEGYARSVDKGEAARVGAVNSAAVGGAGGAVVGAVDDGWEGAVAGALAGALVGATFGAAEGGISATDTQALVLRRCLQNQGYTLYDID
ncbi:glycine zipper family protein [Ferrimonas balearica]|uniref:glycine zipper family protein n=1 Tax=Ferrimonas balearica TaxID=44012 RepID=UPI001C99C2A4|nr:glycine zipper family protein [Ferrimonas balearica]MBY5993009.1 glycine zipper family protein [Ferrimonas balearica]